MVNKRGVKKKLSLKFFISIFDYLKILLDEINKKKHFDKIDTSRNEHRKKQSNKNNEKIFSSSEKAIIHELISDPRKTYIAISKRLGISRHTAKKKIETMLKQEKIQFFIGINYQKLNIDFLGVIFSIKNLKYLEEIYIQLQECPRVFRIIKNIPQNNLYILFGVERSSSNSEGLWSCMIEKWQMDERISSIKIMCINPQFFPPFIPLFLTLNENNMDNPCENYCPMCEQYITEKCTGCSRFRQFEKSIIKDSQKFDEPYYSEEVY